MRVIVCGSRNWTDREQIAHRLSELPGTTTIVHGAAKGADQIAHQEGQKLGLLLEPHPADWGALGKRAGVIRNMEMAYLGADLCIAFWDGRSAGTRDMVDRAEAQGIPIELYCEGRPKLGASRDREARVAAPGESDEPETVAPRPQPRPKPERPKPRMQEVKP